MVLFNSKAVLSFWKPLDAT